MATARGRARISASGNDAHKALVQFPLIVEDRLADLVDRPDALGVVRVIDEPAREHLVAVAGRVKEIDRLAAGDAVPRRADIERDVVARDDVGGLADLVPGIERERDVMKLARLGAPDKGDVVRLVRAAENAAAIPSGVSAASVSEKSSSSVKNSTT
jgi:hypothetical protein